MIEVTFPPGTVLRHPGDTITMTDTALGESSVGRVETCLHPKVIDVDVTLDGLPIYRCGQCGRFFVFRETRAFGVGRVLAEVLHRIRAEVNEIEIDR